MKKNAQTKKSIYEEKKDTPKFLSGLKKNLYINEDDKCKEYFNKHLDKKSLHYSHNITVAS